MNIKQKRVYECINCEIKCSTKFNYLRHIKSERHNKIEKNIKIEKQVSVTPEKKMSTKYCCNYCQFTSTVKREAKAHQTFNSHTTNNNDGDFFLKMNKNYTCVNCNKCYDKYISCWKHSKTCQVQKNDAVTETPTEICLPIKKEKPKRKTIPLALKRIVWNKYIGEEIGKTQCLCCKLTDISQMNFSCGHIISDYNGGDISFENLKPICSSCNSSMGTQNMDEFIQIYGF